MTPTPPSTTSSSAGPVSPDAQHRVVRKRNRVPLSCGPCRHRKLKCNRAHPCDNCIKRGDTPSCTYAQPGNRKRNQSSGGASSSPDEMQNRIDRLESLVLSLMTNGSQAGGSAAAAVALNNTRSNESTEPSQDFDDDMKEDQSQLQRDEDSEVEQVSRSIGVMKVQNDRQFYASEAHWWAILSDIAEVKSYFAEHKKQYEDQMRKVQASKTGNSTIGTTLFFKGVNKLEREDIMTMFPAKPVADKLITRYFNSENPAVRILHGPTFRKEYERHWEDPGETSIVWIGMCFAMMCMALQSYHRAGDEPLEYRGKTWEHSLEFLECTTQCLVSADFTQPMNYMMETLCFYLQAEHARSRENETGLWILDGMITRMAMRMGLHRDSKPYASISPYLGEMRRRLWNVIRSMDVLLSFGCGLPSMIRSTDCDTTLPTNVYDEEFEQDTKELPAPRPATEITPVSFMIAHGRFCSILGIIMEQAQSLAPLSYEDTMKLDNHLRQAMSDVPANLQLHTKEESLLDPASVIMQRYTLDLMYQKCQCVLHRKFLSRARENPRYSYSRRTCIDSCMELLDHQATIHAECQPGGRLRTITWSVNSSLTTNDFLLAAMIICLDLYYTAQAEKEGRTSGELYTWALERRDAMFAAIDRAVGIWDSMKDQSMEAYKASGVLSVMLVKLKNHQVLRQQMNENFSFVPNNNGVSPDGNVAPEHSAAMTLGMMSTGMTPDVMGMYDRNYQGQQPQPGQQPQQQQQQNQNGVSPQVATDAAGNPLPPPVDGMSPFSNLFGPNPGAFQPMDLPATNFDWDAWDTFIQGSNVVDQNSFIDSALLDGSAQQQFGDGKSNPTVTTTNTWSPNNNNLSGF